MTRRWFIFAIIILLLGTGIGVWIGRGNKKESSAPSGGNANAVQTVSEQALPLLMGRTQPPAQAAVTVASAPPVYAALNVSESQTIEYPGHGITFRVPAGWRLERYVGAVGFTEQRGDTIIDRSTEVSSFGGHIPHFIQLRDHNGVVEMDLKLTPGFKSNDLPDRALKEFTFSDGTYRARYSADCESEKLMHIEKGERALLVQVEEFCDTPEQERPDIDAAFRAVIEGFSFTR